MTRKLHIFNFLLVFWILNLITAHESEIKYPRFSSRCGSHGTGRGFSVNRGFSLLKRGGSGWGGFTGGQEFSPSMDNEGLYKRELGDSGDSGDSGNDYDKRLFNYNAYQRNANKRAFVDFGQMLKKPMMSPTMYNRPITFVAEKRFEGGNW